MDSQTINPAMNLIKTIQTKEMTIATANAIKISHQELAKSWKMNSTIYETNVNFTS